MLDKYSHLDLILILHKIQTFSLITILFLSRKLTYLTAFQCLLFEFHIIWKGRILFIFLFSRINFVLIYKQFFEQLSKIIKFYIIGQT